MPDFNSSLLATGFPYSRLWQTGCIPGKYLSILCNTRPGSDALGSAAADLAYVACGRFEGFYEYGLHAWDVAAGAFIVQMAGGESYRFQGGKQLSFSVQNSSPEIIRLISEMLKVIDQKSLTANSL
jgi:myo-inositol-1(or 4)-monophosphatase